MEKFIRIMRVLMVRKIGLRMESLVRQAAGSHSHSMIMYILGQEMLKLGTETAPFLLRELIMGASLKKPGFTQYLQHVGDARALASRTGNEFMSELLS